MTHPNNRTNRRELAKETIFKFCPTICGCLVVLLVLIVVGGVFTDWADECIDHYRTMHSAGHTQDILIKTCQANVTNCGVTDICECQEVNDPYSVSCEEPTSVATGGWGRPIFATALACFMLVLFCSPCALGAFICYKAQHPEPGPYDPVHNQRPAYSNATTTNVPPQSATIVAQTPSPIVEESAIDMPVLKLDPKDEVPAANPSVNSGLPLANAQPIKE